MAPEDGRRRADSRRRWPESSLKGEDNRLNVAEEGCRNEDFAEGMSNRAPKIPRENVRSPMCDSNNSNTYRDWSILGQSIVVKPEQASFYDLVLFLLSPKASDTTKFVENSEAALFGKFWRRWYIFISLLGQKLFIMGEKPMAQFGHVLELWLNLLSRKVVWPQSQSATYKSVIECLDERLDLDKSIGQGNKDYNKALSVMACKITYENEAFIQAIVEDHWNMKFVKYYNCWNDYQEQFSTQAIMLQNTKDNPNLIVVAFKGTGPFDAVAWRADFDLSWVEFAGEGKLQSGFCKALGMQKEYNGFPKEIEQRSDQRQFAYYAIRERLIDMLQKNENAKFVVTGHSLGGALAVLRGGTSQGRTGATAQAYSEEPNKNYFSVFWVIPKYITANVELIRSFVIPYIRGPDYKETLLMKIFRASGLVIPGLPAHSTQDYVSHTIGIPYGL
ncbi:hypothetical protein CJ030_MR3G017052 [Morella rubra]|uniref:Fungal lipase-type domain-containing protein n=1 Tax=Morella rubra TaxID=262757 RepID=A0A6A1W965_9ROSI|nr:hypothetical protein CJ030_MR3G017052 [Morella rubra]